MQSKSIQNRLMIYATVFLILFSTYYIPIDTRGGFGPLKLGLMVASVFVLLAWGLQVTKAMAIGTIYLISQFTLASFYSETLRWSTLLFSVGLVYSYVSFYNLIYVRRVFTIDHFIRIVKWLIYAYFVVCIIQQVFLLLGVSYLPIINLVQVLNRGIGCNSLSMEPSTFARFMLVFYYAYVKCHEYRRGEGPFSVKELFSADHRWVTICFLWMMCTMGSGTAFVCLILFSFYFVRRDNWFYIIPLMLGIYFFILPLFDAEQLNRATSVTNAFTTFDQQQVEAADGSAASRISPLINSFNADFSKTETWFGYGIDYVRTHNLVLTQKATLFDDYGFVFYLIGLVFNFACAYRFFSLATLFMFAGVGGGAGTNIHYAWALMMFMTCVRYFYENRHNLKTSICDGLPS